MNVVALFGPTGTGKTALAAALADRLPCHLVSCDAVQVYRDLSAAAAKPEGPETRHPWALVDIAEPGHDLNVSDWVRRAETEIAWAHRAGRLPLVVGGTGLYLRGLVKGIAAAPPRDEALRARLEETLRGRGVPYLHRVLGRIDPETAARLAPNDRQRIVRALEVRLVTGTSITRLQAGQWGGPDRFRVLRIGLELPRAELYPRLDARVLGFFERGLVAEVDWLLGTRGVPATANALRGIGYREVVAARRLPADARALVEAVRGSTRHYAKRQWTWFRRETPAAWHDAREEGLADRLAARIAAWAAGHDGHS